MWCAHRAPCCWAGSYIMRGFRAEFKPKAYQIACWRPLKQHTWFRVGCIQSRWFGRSHKKLWPTVSLHTVIVRKFDFIRRESDWFQRVSSIEAKLWRGGTWSGVAALRFERWALNASVIKTVRRWVECGWLMVAVLETSVSKETRYFFGRSWYLWGVLA